MVCIGIVILHYINVEETKLCVESFLKQKSYNFDVQIVIVDNGSNNSTGQILKEKYQNYNFIKVLILKENLGFAKGNNRGIRYLKENFITDFVVCSNSDISFNNCDFYNWIISDYKKYNFAVLGPSIYSTSQKYYQSPIPNLKYKVAIKNLRNFKRELMMINSQKYKLSLILFNLMKRLKQIRLHFTSQINYTKVYDKFTLHGAIIIFSQKYFDYYPEGFFDKTFLYYEEDILRLNCDLKNLSMIYDGSYKVNHTQAASTDMVVSDSFRKNIFRLNNMVESLEQFLNLCKIYNYYRK